MENINALDAQVYRARLDRSGRIVLPQPVRQSLHLDFGDEVLVVQTSEGYRIETPEQALRAAQDYLCSLVPRGVSLADELVADRREEAAREQAEETAQHKTIAPRPRE